MNFNRRIFFLLICALLFSFLNVVAQKYAPVVIQGSERRSLSSSDTGRDYDLYIRVPSDLKSGKKYPVLYLLDGQWDFKLLDSIHGGLFYDKFIPEMVIVGITYTGANPDYNALRAWDYTPTVRKDDKNTGDAPKFLNFLKKDVIPLVENDYNGDPNKRVLMGSSLGGLFTLYVMFTESTLFYGYVAAAPAVRYDNDFAFNQEAQFYSKNKSLPVRLAISVGGVEGLTPAVKKFMETLKTRNYSGLKLDARVIEDEGHAGNKPEAYNRGLRFVFSQ